MDIEEIKAKVHANQYVYTYHDAEIERRADELTFAQVEEALLSGEILEQYPDTGRGESCLIVGFAGDVPIHTAVLKEIERHFFAIQCRAEEPDRYIEMPAKAYA